MTTAFVSEDGINFYPRQRYSKISPSRIEVKSRPNTTLVIIDKVQEWVDEDPETQSSDVIDLLTASSDHLCGPNSITGKCFREWELIDYYEITKLSKYDAITITFPSTQEIVSLSYIDRDNMEQIIDPSMYQFLLRGWNNSVLKMREDVDIGIVDHMFPTTLKVRYKSSADKDASDVPIIPNGVVQLCKHLIFDGFQRQGVQIGIGEGAGVKNKFYENLLNQFLY